MPHVRYLPIAIFLLPFAAANLAWLMSTLNGSIPVCVPYWEGCVSISGAARQVPTIYLFRGLVIPGAVLTGVFWLLVLRWLASADGQSRFHRVTLTLLGLAGSAFLIVYAITLGTDTAAYRLMRRYGINLYYGLTYLAQVMLAGQLLAYAQQMGLPRWIPRWKVGICVLTLLLGLASVFIKEWADDRRIMGNIFEWNLSVLLVGYYLLSFLAWRTSGFAGRSQRRGPGDGPARE
ncbi:MAG: hypothetical protein QNJ40_05880 [Xanthomonadales bacterium]|nr:hypothetical protein [Xanthomonadales bacterium]